MPAAFFMGPWAMAPGCRPGIPPSIGSGISPGIRSTCFSGSLSRESVRFGTYTRALRGRHCSHAWRPPTHVDHQNRRILLPSPRTILTLSLLACAAGTAFAGGPAGEGSDWPPLPQGGTPLSRAQVQADTQAARDHGTLAMQGDQMYIAPSAASHLDRATVRAEAAQALRAGLIPSGDASTSVH